MRVYEIAKQLGISSKEVIALLEQDGKFSVSSHMMVVSEEMLAHLNNKMTGKNFAKPMSTDTKEKELSKTDLTAAKQASVDASSPVIVEADDTVLRDDIAEQEEKIVARLAPKRTVKGGGAPVVRKPVARPADLSRGRQDTSTRTMRDEQKRQRISEIIIDRDMLLSEVADRLGKAVGDVMLVLMRKGFLYNRNQLLTKDIIGLLAQDFGVRAVFQTADAGKVATEALAKINQGVPRWPVVVVMGHVDHGKTTLLDYIRKANVAGREKGGITQHLGAYEVETDHGRVVFLDTPGHEAFPHIRKHGTQVTDIVVLVVAADDGIMPQTVEALECARSAGVPIIVAINKIDKISSPAALDRVKRQLAERDLMAEDWGGQTVCMPISAKTGQGVPELLEMIALQAELMELKSDAEAQAVAYTLETRVERGYGAIATIILRQGTLRRGDYFVCGETTGRVRLLISANGARCDSVGPSTPVMVVGFDALPKAGDWLKQVNFAEYQLVKSQQGRPTVSQATSQHVASTSSPEGTLALLVKADADGSLQAVLGGLVTLVRGMKDRARSYTIIQTGIGDVTESDVNLAANTGALIVCLHVKVERKAALLAKEKRVAFLEHDIIYHLLGDLQAKLEKKKEQEFILAKIGDATVLKIFNIKGYGVIAGASVSSGIFTRTGTVVCIRGGREVGRGAIVSLQRDKKNVKEVHTGFEFAFISGGFQEWEVGDTVHCLAEKPKE